MGEFVSQAVAEKLAEEGRLQDKPWLECAGELRHLHDETSRILRRIDEEFLVIEPMVRE